MPEREQAKNDVGMAFSAWQNALASGDPDQVVELYAEHSVLLATLEARPLVTQDERRGYFTSLMSQPNLHVRIVEEHRRAMERDYAVISGLYTFAYTVGDHIEEIPARFSFVYEKRGDIWRIIAHHSSRVPERQSMLQAAAPQEMRKSS